MGCIPAEDFVLARANYGPAQWTVTAAASRQQQRGDSRLGSNAAQQQLVLLRRRLRLIIRRLIIRLSLRSPSGGPHGLHTCRLRPQGERSIGVILEGGEVLLADDAAGKKGRIARR